MPGLDLFAQSADDFGMPRREVVLLVGVVLDAIEADGRRVPGVDVAVLCRILAVEADDQFPFVLDTS